MNKAIEAVKRTIAIWEKRGEGDIRLMDCPLCDYVEGMECAYGQKRHRCFYCPYYQHFGSCDNNGTPYTRWMTTYIPKWEQKAAWDAVAQLQCILDSLEEDDAVR